MGVRDQLAQRRRCCFRIVVGRQDFTSDTEMGRGQRIVELIVRHRTDQLRNACPQRLTGRADAPVMNEGSQFRQ